MYFKPKVSLYSINLKSIIMNLTHLHLVTNHIPVIGLAFGILCLLGGMFRKSLELQVAGYVTFILSTFGVIIAYFTGEPAVESVEYIFDVTEQSIDAHANAAKATFFSMLVLSVLSVIALLLANKQPSRVAGFAQIVLLVAAVSFGLAAYTSNLGGKIRHTELDQKVMEPRNEDLDEIYE
jgi:uncharacterized membrane protein